MKAARSLTAALFAALALALLGSPGFARRVAAPGRSAPWPDEVRELAEALPIQDGGRIKPLHTFASFTLLRLNGRRSAKTVDGERLTAVDWLLDVLFFPEEAETHPVFLVQSSEVVEALGITRPEGRKERDRYSFAELRPGLDRLFQLAGQYHAIDEKQQTSVQRQVLLLATNVQSYAGLVGTMDFARVRLDVPEELVERLGGSSVHVSALPERLGPLLGMRGTISPDVAPSEARAISDLMVHASTLLSRAESLAMFPPSEPASARAEWLAPADVFFESLHGTAGAGDLALLEALADSRDDPAAFADQLGLLSASVRERAERRGEYAKVGLELTYYKSRLLDYSQYGFVLAFLMVAGVWLRPKSRLLYGGTAAVVLGSSLLLVAAIAMRCVIRNRPPVSTLYETVLFVTAVGALIALFVEAVNRQRIALSAGALMGFVGLFIANGYEMLDKRDTMPSLVAVLDTNFWLATHVTAITAGYSAGMLAALLASVYLVAKTFGWRRGDRDFYRGLGKMVYGVLAFALIFSIVGTILGGIWANDSWGRFWGWDPKENGALLIVISQLVILHGRMGGYLREHGLCMATAFGGTVIAFSWWGVNLLGVGLHSYGFTSGIAKALWIYYGIQWGIVALGGVGGWLERRAASVPRTARVETGPRGRLEEHSSPA